MSQSGIKTVHQHEIHDLIDRSINDYYVSSSSGSSPTPTPLVFVTQSSIGDKTVEKPPLNSNGSVSERPPLIRRGSVTEKPPLLRRSSVNDRPPLSRRGSINESPLKRAPSFSPSAGTRRRHLWETVRESPRLIHSKCSIHCRHGLRSRICSTDEESEVSSSVPPSPMKKFANKQSCPRLAGIVSHASRFSKLESSVPYIPSGDWTDDGTNESATEDIVKINENENSALSSDSEGPRSKNGNVRYLQSKPSKGKALNTIDPKTFNLYFRSESVKGEKEYRESKDRNIIRTRTVDKAEDSRQDNTKPPVSVRPKIMKCRDAVGRVVSKDHRNVKDSSGTTVGYKTASNDNLSNLNVKNGTKLASNVEKCKGNSSGAVKNSLVGTSTSKAPLWNRIKRNPSVEIDRYSKDDKGAVSSNKIFTSRLSAASGNKATRQWNSIKKNIVDSKAKSNKIDMKADVNVKEPAYESSNEEGSETLGKLSEDENESSNNNKSNSSFAGKLSQRRCSLQIDDRNGIRSDQRDNLNTLHGSSSNLSVGRVSSRRNSTHSLQGSRCSSRSNTSLNGPGSSSRCSSSLSNKGSNLNLRGSKTDVSDYSPSKSGRVWNPYWNSKMNIAPKETLPKTSDNCRSSNIEASHNFAGLTSPTKAKIFREDSEGCKSGDEANDLSDDSFGELTFDNMRNRGDDCSGRVTILRSFKNSGGSSSFERDSAIGSMNSLRDKNAFDRDPLSSSVKSLDSWESPKVGLNRNSRTGSVRSLDGMQSNCHRNNKVISRKGFSSLNDIACNSRPSKYRDTLRSSNASLNSMNKYSKKRNSSYHINRGLPRSVSGYNVREDLEDNLGKNPAWNSLPKLNRGWDSIRQCILEKTNKWLPKHKNSNPTINVVPDRKVCRGWESIRRKIMDKDWKREARKAVDNFQTGGGEGESEWVNTQEIEDGQRQKRSSDTLQVDTQRSRSLSNGRAPKFSELFGDGKDRCRTRSRVAYDTDDDDPKLKASKRSKSLGRSRSKRRRGKERKREDIERERHLQIAILRSLQHGSGSETEDETSQPETHESGLGSSCDEGSDNNDQTENTPTHPQKVYAAITNYLLTVDQHESDDDVDSFSREADAFDPEELLLLTDNEDNLTWEDIICYNMSPVAKPKHEGVKDACDSIQPDFDPSRRNSACNRRLEKELDEFLGNYYQQRECDTFASGWQNLQENHGTLQATRSESDQRKSDDNEPVDSDPNKSPERDSREQEKEKQENEEEVNEREDDDASSSQEDTRVSEYCQRDLQGYSDQKDDASGESDVAVRETTETVSQNGSSDVDSPRNEMKEEVPQTDDVTVESPRGRSRTKEDRSSSAVSAERSVSCSENIKAFLLSQPCAKAHCTHSSEGGVECDCKDKHTLVVSEATGQTEVSPCQHREEEPKKKKNKKKKCKSTEQTSKEESSKGKTVMQTFLSLFCTTPVTVEGIAPDTESHDTDPEPLPPPIPPHAVDPEIMTADEAQRLLSAKESQSILSDEEAQEVVLLLSPQEGDSSKILPPPVPPHNGDRLPSVPPHYDIPPAVPPHYADMAPPVPPHYTPTEDEFDTRVASHFDPTLASPLSPEDEPSEADSSEASGDACQVSRVKEVLVEDGVHYLEDGHFWVEVPGLPEDDDEEDNDPMLPFHPHTKLSFSKDPIQVFSTYSVTEYDRKNDDVDPVAASAEYELEKRVEKMDLFPVEIIKGEGGLGLSIIGMGVGADAGVEKLGIFVKTITPGGATERDGRIQVNDQIIEVDGKSLVGVTQVFAASVLKNTSGRVHFLIGREKDPENSEVALLIKQSLQADREREERRRALGGPDYDPRNGHSIYDPLSSPSEENSRSEEASAPQNYSSYFEGGSSPTSPDAVSPPIESFDLEGDTSDTSPENDITAIKLKLKETQYRNAVAEAEVTKLKMTLLEMEKIVSENAQYTSQLSETQSRLADTDSKLQSKLSEVSTYQDMLEQSQGQFIILEKKYYKAKKIIKEYQGRERDFLHREEYHITQLEEKDSHYNALVKALKDRVISLEEELKNAQKKAGLPVQVPSDTDVQPAYLDLQQSAQSALAKQPPRKPSLCTLDPEISDTETDNGASEGDKANTVERKIPVKEELDEAVPPHELLDVSASRAKGELASRGGLANRHLPSLKKTTSMSSAGSQEHSLDDSSLDDELPESQKHTTVETLQDAQQEQGNWRSAEPQEISKLSQSPPPQQSQSTPQPPPSSSQTPQITSINSSISQVKSSQPPPYSHATMGSVSYLGSPPPPYHPPPGQFGIPRPPLAPSDPSTGLPSRPLGATVDSHAHDPRADSRPEIPYRHPPPVARVLPVNRAEISESATLAAHLANRTPQQQSLAEQLKALLAEREVQSDVSQRNEREASPSKRSPTSLMEDVRQAVLQADVSSHMVTSGQLAQQVNSPNRSQTSGFYSVGGRDSIRDSSAGSQSPKLGRSSIHASPVSGVSANPAGVVLLSQRPLDSSLPVHKFGPDGSSGDLSSGPASLGSGDEGSGASLGSQTSLSHTHPPTDRTKRSHMWQTAPVVDWTKEQVSQWLVVQGLESCVSRFQDIGMTGPRLLNLDIRDLKSLGLPADEKSKLKRKVKELRLAVEKERKQAEKEKKERERLQKKAEKLAEKAEKKKK